MVTSARARHEQASAQPTADSVAALRPDLGDTVVIIPMFNEASVIGEVVSRLRRDFSQVVCVDDGSTDDSAAAATVAGAVVVRHPANLGQGAALQTGIEFALSCPQQFRFFVTFDADGQHRVEDAVALLDRARLGTSDVVLGSRFLTPTGQVPFVRRLVLRGAVAFTRVTTGLALTDAHNGLRVLNRAAATAMKLRLTGMAHASEILEVIAREQLTYSELPIEVLYTDYSRAKGQSSVNALNIVFDLMANKVRVAR